MYRAMWVFDIDVNEAEKIINSQHTDFTRDELMIIYFIKERKEKLVRKIAENYIVSRNLENSILEAICEMTYPE